MLCSWNLNNQQAGLAPGKVASGCRWTPHGGQLVSCGSCVFLAVSFSFSVVPEKELGSCAQNLNQQDRTSGGWLVRSGSEVWPLRSARPETHELSAGVLQFSAGLSGRAFGCSRSWIHPKHSKQQANKIRCPGFSGHDLQTGCCRNGQVACPVSLRTGLRHTLLPTVSMAYCPCYADQ